jgi:hypothetical protein
VLTLTRTKSTTAKSTVMSFIKTQVVKLKGFLDFGPVTDPCFA